MSYIIYYNFLNFLKRIFMLNLLDTIIDITLRYVQVIFSLN